jgi:DNA polymerase V
VVRAMTAEFFSRLTGFPSPAEAYSEHRLALSQLLVPHPEATFFLRFRGASMWQAGIRDGDILVVDRALPAVHYSIIVASIREQLTVRRLYLHHGIVQLKAEHPRFPLLTVTPAMHFAIWGVVSWVLHAVSSSEGRTDERR